MKISVDADRCTGHGRCYTLAPDLLKFDDDGYVTARGQVIDVPDGQLPDAREAADSCPEGAIALLLTPGEGHVDA
jgi:ferredoxin